MNSLPPHPPRRILKIECPDEKGLVHRITGCLLDHGLNMIANGEIVEPDTRRFFMRAEVEGPVADKALARDLARVLPPLAKWEILIPRPKRIVLMVSREAHCIGDLLVRHQFGEIDAEIVGVIGNHDRLQPLVERFDLPFHCVPHGEISREAHEEHIMEIVDGLSPDYIVLAKYMRVLTPGFVRKYHPRIVNIHHSFLPAFVGANPYRQAHQRGVKIIGATAHFVTDNLDEGPIIAQDVFRVLSHYTAAQMTKAGRNVEKHVLNRALYLVFEDRVFISGNKTIIFE